MLDVATGTGNAALAAARSECVVTGLDYVSELLEHGRRRASAEGLDVAGERLRQDVLLRTKVTVC